MEVDACSSRSPCPANALANHGYLSRDCKDISYGDIQSAASNAFNFASDIFLFAFMTANETLKLSTTRSSPTINLKDLARHNTNELDGSQTYNDIYFGDDLHYNATEFEPVAADFGLDTDSPDDAFVTVETAAKARANRFAKAMNMNP